ncbi:MAG: siderophore-interacting protein [Myxococcota bacterium]|nr:siderophore-interacting protein [Myxococcota bacterium]
MAPRTRRPRPPVHAATVDAVTDLSPRVRCIRLSAPDLVGTEWQPGQKIKIKVADWLRSYTPARVDAVDGWMDVVFFLHGNGSASQWAASAQVGEPIQYVGPSKSVSAAQGEPAWALFLGDESTIGLATALMESLPAAVQKLGAIELDAVDVPSLEAFGLPLDPAIRCGEHGDALQGWLREVALPGGEGVVWVSGEALAARGLRESLMQRKPDGIQFHLKAYWSSRGHAHRKALEQEQAAEAAKADE